MTRTLRSHQAETDRIACQIAAGSPITDIYESVTPGGGKSALPGILANRLIGTVIDRILWIAPRSALREQGESGGSGEGGEGSGQARPWITPIGSEAYRSGAEKEIESANRPDGGMAPKAAENLLRTQIADHIEVFLSRKAKYGSKAAYSTIIHAKLKELVGGKKREECSVTELTKQFAFLKERFPV